MFRWSEYYRDSCARKFPNEARMDATSTPGLTNVHVRVSRGQEDYLVLCASSTTSHWNFLGSMIPSRKRGSSSLLQACLYYILVLLLIIPTYSSLPLAFY